MQDDNDLVGVVVPMFNSERTISASLKSICGQTHRRLDIVVVDDGSTDGSAAVAAAWQARDPRVRLVHQANAGVAAARNKGAASTDAKLLAFVDADDLDDLSSRQIALEAARSRALLEHALGEPCLAIAAPFGEASDRFVRIAQGCGYKVGFTVDPGFAWLSNDLLRLPRIEVLGGWTIEAFADAVRPATLTRTPV